MDKFNLSKRQFLAGGTAIAIGASVGFPMRAIAVEFAGETINFVNFGGPGSPPDVWYRSLVPFLERHIEGNPHINVINRPGAGSMIAANYTAQALPNDGLNIGSMNAVAMAKAARGDQSAQFDLNELEIVGAQRLTRVIVVKKDGISGMDDLLAMDGQLVVGMESDARPYYDSFFDLTGINSLIISSYQRFPDTLQAFRTGEVDAMSMSAIEWMTFGPDLSEAGAVLAWQIGFGGTDGTVTGFDALDIPTGHGVVEQVNPDAVGSDAWNVMMIQALGQTVSNQIWAPAGTPSDYVEALSAGFVAATSDPEFIAQHTEQYGLAPEWTNAADARAVIDQVISVSM